ncbi:hypothetical protein K4H00_25315, partial [Mycobacterium tuberculosis]|nr:hypothetical protein [Mycobacterium tuberculosis]
TTLFDPLDTATEPYVLMAMTGEIHDGHRRVVSKRFSFVALHSNGSVADAGPAPHLDLSPLPDAATAAASKALTENWIRADLA